MANTAQEMEKLLIDSFYSTEIDERMAMELAFSMAARSPDPSTQNGAVLIDRKGWLIGLGYNRFPDKVACTEERLKRPAKYHLIWHAEESALYDAVRRGFDLDRSTLVCPWQACSECAKAIVGLGVSRIVRLNNNAPNVSWDESIRYGDII